MKSRAYRSSPVKQLEPKTLLEGREGQSVVVGLDIGKKVILVMLRWNGDDYARPVRVQNPGELLELVALLKEVGQGRSMKIALEPTGSYGDALRQALHDAPLVVHRVSAKATKDYAETFDGVPSQHDGKDAAVIAELAAIGKCWEWKYPIKTEAEEEISYLVDSLKQQRRLAMHWVGQLEALVVRHWPEVTRLAKLTSGVLLRVLSVYGSPAALAADAEGQKKLQRWGGHYWGETTVQAVWSSASSTMGMRMSRWDIERMREAANHLRAYRKLRAAKWRRLKALGEKNPMIKAQSAVVGMTTACVLWDALGDPKDYHCGAAYRKAMGLNLAERSSGQWEGKLKITKRGSSEVRRYLYLAALRWVKDSAAIRSWYRRQQERRRGESKPVTVGVMRKLALACWQVGARGVTFEAEKVFAPQEPSAKKQKSSQQRKKRQKVLTSRAKAR